MDTGTSLSGLYDLPESVVLVLLDCVASISNTGQIVQLAAASRQCMQLVAGAEWFWQQQCQQLGWLRAGVDHPPNVSAPQVQVQRHPWTSSHKQQQQAGAWRCSPLLSSLQASPWFQYYTLRMSSRWRLRTLMRKYIPFLNIHSRLAIQPGASIQQLSAAEARLGMKLPWELWELYRFRSGQAAGGGVSFADSCRLLGLEELRVSQVDEPSNPCLSPTGPLLQEQQLAALQSQLPELTVMTHQLPAAAAAAAAGSKGSSIQAVAALAGAAAAAELSGNAAAHTASQEHLSISCGASGSGRDTAQGAAAAATAAAAAPAAAAAGSSTPVVVFMSNVMGSTSYGVSQDATVHILRGFTQRRIASSLSGFLQHLLT